MFGDDLLLTNRKHFNYSKSFCAFLDILGFEALVNSNNPDDKKKLERKRAIIPSFLI